MLLFVEDASLKLASFFCLYCFPPRVPPSRACPLTLTREPPRRRRAPIARGGAHRRHRDGLIGTSTCRESTFVLVYLCSYTKNFTHPYQKFYTPIPFFLHTPTKNFTLKYYYCINNLIMIMEKETKISFKQLPSNLDNFHVGVKDIAVYLTMR